MGWTKPVCEYDYHVGAAVKPFLKWPGGKSWLVPHLMKLTAGLTYGTYFEPFLGGGAFYFALNPRQAILSDVNLDLINAYSQVQLRYKAIIEQLKVLPVNEERYYDIRSSTPTQRLDRAVRFLYLNRTAFGGIYRLNQKGHFNVPFGGGERTPARLWEHGLLRSASMTLRSAQLSAGDFEEVLKAAKSGDLIYCDPTYTVAHNKNGFVRYNEKNFCWDDQKRLAATCLSLRKLGCTVIVSNAVHPCVRELYAPDQSFVFERSITVARKVESRRRVQEELMMFCP